MEFVRRYVYLYTRDSYLYTVYMDDSEAYGTLGKCVYCCLCLYKIQKLFNVFDFTEIAKASECTPMILNDRRPVEMRNKNELDYYA